MKCLFLFLLLTQLCIAQKSSIHGSVKDSTSGEPIIFAHIYIANTTKGTTSDINGQFILENIPAGKFTLVCSMVGYESYIKSINLLPDRQLELVFELKTSTNILNGIELVDKEDKKWKKEFMEFKRELLGNMPNAEYCEIINPWVVDFEEYRREKIINARVNQPLIVQNNALGYKISFLVIRFEKANDRLFYIGYPNFKNMNVSDSSQVVEFIENRKDTYEGSLKHFFYTLIHNRLEEEGFRVFQIADGYEDIMNESLKETLYKNYFKPLEVAEVVSGPSPWGIYTINTNRMLEIIYTKKRWKDSHYFDARYQVSRIQLTDKLEVSQNGYVFNPYSYVVFGYLSEERVANMLPFEYSPEISSPINY